MGRGAGNAGAAPATRDCCFSVDEVGILAIVRRDDIFFGGAFSSSDDGTSKMESSSNRSLTSSSTPELDLVFNRVPDVRDDDEVREANLELLEVEPELSLAAGGRVRRIEVMTSALDEAFFLDVYFRGPLAGREPDGASELKFMSEDVESAFEGKGKR